MTYLEPHENFPELDALYNKYKDQADEFIESHLTDKSPFFLAFGAFATVYDLGGGKVLRVSQDIPRKMPEHKHINPRLACLVIGDSFKDRLTLEVFPKCICPRFAWDSPEKQIYKQAANTIAMRLDADGVLYWDLEYVNVGFNDENIPVVVDPGCILAYDEEGNKIIDLPEFKEPISHCPDNPLYIEDYEEEEFLKNAN